MSFNDKGDDPDNVHFPVFDAEAAGSAMLLVSEAGTRGGNLLLLLTSAGSDDEKGLTGWKAKSFGTAVVAGVGKFNGRKA